MLVVRSPPPAGTGIPAFGTDRTTAATVIDGDCHQRVWLVLLLLVLRLMIQLHLLSFPIDQLSTALKSDIHSLSVLTNLTYSCS